MNVCVRLSSADPGVLVFGRSPAREALHSLHVLGSVRQHPLHISWVLEARERMGADLKNEADQFAFWCQGRPLGFPRIWRPGEVSSWPDELAALRDAPVTYYAEQMLTAALHENGRAFHVRLDDFRADPALRERAMNAVRARHPASLPVLQELIADPERSRNRFADFLSAYWDACLAPKWPFMERYLLGDIAQRSRTAFQHGLATMLEGLAPGRLRVVQDRDEVLIALLQTRAGAPPLEFTLTEQDRLLLVPSHFAWPLVALTVQREPQADPARHTVQISYALDAMQHKARPPVPSEDLLKLLRAAAHPTRLQILQILAEHARSTRELASLIGLTEAAISKHLKILAEADWVEPERHSYYVYYRLVRDTHGKLADALERLLG
ncbi:metalloregulator ArsR/SmtB family transcription factor [Thermocatellispora tengchongensis]